MHAPPLLLANNHHFYSSPVPAPSTISTLPHPAGPSLTPGSLAGLSPIHQLSLTPCPYHSTPAPIIQPLPLFWPATQPLPPSLTQSRSLRMLPHLRGLRGLRKQGSSRANQRIAQCSCCARTMTDMAAGSCGVCMPAQGMWVLYTHTHHQTIMCLSPRPTLTFPLDQIYLGYASTSASSCTH